MTGYNVQQMLASIAAQLAGVPLQPEQTRNADKLDQAQQAADVQESLQVSANPPRQLRPAFRMLARMCCFATAVDQG